MKQAYTIHRTRTTARPLSPAEWRSWRIPSDAPTKPAPAADHAQKLARLLVEQDIVVPFIGALVKAARDTEIEAERRRWLREHLAPHLARAMECASLAQAALDRDWAATCKANPFMANGAPSYHERARAEHDHYLRLAAAALDAARRVVDVANFGGRIVLGELHEVDSGTDHAPGGYQYDARPAA